MPSYDYKHLGKGCVLGKEFTVTMKITDDPLTHCPECKTQVKPLLTARPSSGGGTPRFH